jgi:putative oxidoreductase
MQTISNNQISNAQAKLSGYAPVALGLMRIVSASIFIEHGTQKLFNFPAGEMGGVELFSIFGLAGIMEVVGGLLLLVGVFTRPVAFILSGQMAVAYWMFHAPSGLFPVNNGGDAAILFCFFFLYLAFAGPGAFALQKQR